MKVEISVPEVVSIFKEIQTKPEKVFEMIRLDVREMVGRYLTEMMEAELTHFLGREPYERKDKDSNHRNGSYGRRFTIKSIVSFRQGCVGAIFFRREGWRSDHEEMWQGAEGKVVGSPGIESR